MSDSNSIKTALRDEDLEWLADKYPTAMSNAERLRNAVNTARNHFEMLEKLELDEQLDKEDLK